jgi:aminoglycoside/choline kinase family phosphotransferase
MTTSLTTIVWADTQRQTQFQHWLDAIAPTYALQITSLRSASADASFRRYFRIDELATGADARSFIIMDAPPDKENSEPFVKIAKLMAGAGLLVPEVLDWHTTNGFMLLTDLGTHTMLDAIDPLDTYARTSSSVTKNLSLYDQAVDALIQWQLASKPSVLPPYDDALLRRELQLFPDWYIAKYRGLTLSDAQQTTLQTAFDRIVAHNLNSPSVYVHRDFMPRNLMMPYAHLTGHSLGVLDFQDAVYGPITYDIASLMRDAFLSWEEDFCLDVTIRYWQKARGKGLPVGNDFGDFYKAVEWMGLQRHLKILGIFARLTLRDGKPKYLADTPRFISYVRATCNRYIELKPLLRLIDVLEG